MRLFQPSRLAAPPADQGWQPQQYGFSATEIRVTTYLGIVLLLGFNGAGLALLGSEFLNDLNALFAGAGKIGGVAVVILAMVAYLYIHEAIHLIAFPDHGLSKDSYVGVLPWAVFVLYNGPVSPRRLMASVSLPFLTLTPLLALFAYLKPGAITTNLLLVHVLSCSGDLLLVWKLSKLRLVDELWTTGTSVWFKYR